MNRRDFLKLCSKYSLSAASFPFLHALPSLASAAELEVTQGKRFMVFYHPHGMHQPGFTCGEGHRSGNDWELSDVLAPLQPVKEKTNVIEGISWEGNPSGRRHQYGMVTMLTGREINKEGFSIDQMAADNWNTDVLNLGVQVAPGLHNAKSNYENIRISFRGARNAGAQNANNNPFTAFQQTFGSIAQEDPYDSFATNRSVLDSVLSDLITVKNKLSAEDRQLLESHEQSIREIECRLHGVYCSDEVSEAIPLATEGVCQVPTMIAQPNNIDNYLVQQSNIPTITRLQSDIAVAAIACNIKPVVVLQNATTESTVTYSWETNDQGNPATSGTHHDLSHNSYTSTLAARNFNAVHRWYAEQVSYIAQKLDNIPEGDGTVLDNTLIYWTTCLGNAHRHWHNNWPAVTIGSAGGFFKTNQSLDYRRSGRCYTDPFNCFRDDPSGTSHIDLLNTVAAGIDLGATNEQAVVGNLTDENDLTYVGRAYHGLMQEMIA